MKLVTLREAAKICGLSDQLLRFRILRGDLPIARRNPTRLRADVVLRYATAMPAVRSYSKRPTLADTLAAKFAKLSADSIS